MEIETTLRLTEVLRAAAIRRAQDALGAVPEVLSGHDGQGKPSVATHAAFLTLPFVSQTQTHADGHILALAVALPRKLPTEERRRVVRALVSLDYLTVAGAGRLRLEKVTPDQAVPHNLRPETWTGPSKRWASVTPVVLDRFPKRNGAQLPAILARSCAHVGLPQAASVTVSRFSPLHGVEPSARYCVRRGGTTPRLFTHATLTFAEEVRGPVLLGAGRHFGLGLFRPVEEGGTREPG
jgi:CRISPR-associated protein Csb2